MQWVTLHFNLIVLEDAHIVDKLSCLGTSVMISLEEINISISRLSKEKYTNQSQHL